MPDIAAPRIFVSHSHEDDTYCRAYVDELRRLLGGERDAYRCSTHPDDVNDSTTSFPLAAQGWPKRIRPQANVVSTLGLVELRSSRRKGRVTKVEQLAPGLHIWEILIVYAPHDGCRCVMVIRERAVKLRIRFMQARRRGVLCQDVLEACHFVVHGLHVAAAGSEISGTAISLRLSEYRQEAIHAWPDSSQVGWRSSIWIGCRGRRWGRGGLRGHCRLRSRGRL